jgi:uncharacterized protein
MHRRDVTLAMLAAAGGHAYTPVQFQKALFLLSRQTPHLFDEGSKFAFQPYDYGPFDQAVYHEADLLAFAGRARVGPSPRGYRTYAASPDGQREGERLLATMAAADREFIATVSSYVRRLSFADLVSAIYKAYPEMNLNSVFVGS